MPIRLDLEGHVMFSNLQDIIKHCDKQLLNDLCEGFLAHNKHQLSYTNR